MLECPKCTGSLEKTTVEDVYFHLCNICSGIWITHKSLKKLLRRDTLCFNSTDLNDLNYSSKHFRLSKEILSKPAICPLCPKEKKTEHLKPCHYKKITIYKCIQKHGEWLDGGEIHKIRNPIVKYFFTFLVIVLAIIMLAIFFFLSFKKSRSSQKSNPNESKPIYFSSQLPFKNFYSQKRKISKEKKHRKRPGL